MAPIAQIPCFAAKDASGKLERWQYEPKPLTDGDIGTCAMQAASRTRCPVTGTVLGHKQSRPSFRHPQLRSKAAVHVYRDPRNTQWSLPFRHSRLQERVGRSPLPNGPRSRGVRLFGCLALLR